MSKGPISIPRARTAQPDPTNTLKGQKRYRLGPEYNPEEINPELDYIHERINQVVLESPPLADLDSGATLGEVITRVNELTEILRSSGLLKP